MVSPPSTRVNPAALAGFLLGLASLLLLALTGVPAVVLGLRGLRAVNASDGRLRGRRLALAGLVLGGLTSLVTVVGVGALTAVHLRALSGRTESANNLRQIGQALNSYHDVRRTFPAAAVRAPDIPPEHRLSWMTEVLPFLGDRPRFRTAYQTLASRLDPLQPYDAPANSAGLDTPLRVFLCSTHPDFHPGRAPGVTHYVGLCGIDPDAIRLPRDNPRAGLFGYDRGVARKDVKAGISFTFMAAETTHDNGPWVAAGFPTARGVDPHEENLIGPGQPFGGLHHGGTYTLWVDGSARWVSDTTPGKVFRAHATLGGDRVD
jgi:hypothetical protein